MFKSSLKASDPKLHDPVIHWLTTPKGQIFWTVLTGVLLTALALLQAAVGWYAFFMFLIFIYKGHVENVMVEFKRDSKFKHHTKVKTYLESMLQNAERRVKQSTSENLQLFIMVPDRQEKYWIKSIDLNAQKDKGSVCFPMTQPDTPSPHWTAYAEETNAVPTTFKIENPQKLIEIFPDKEVRACFEDVVFGLVAPIYRPKPPYESEYTYEDLLGILVIYSDTQSGSVLDEATNSAAQEKSCKEAQQLCNYMAAILCYDCLCNG